jgi:hypothetical protein
VASIRTLRRGDINGAFSDSSLPLKDSSCAGLVRSASSYIQQSGTGLTYMFICIFLRSHIRGWEFHSVYSER